MEWISPIFSALKLVDHVFGHQFSHLTDTREALDQDRVDRPLVLKTLQEPDRYVLNHVLPACGTCRICLQERSVPGVQPLSACHRPGR